MEENFLPPEERLKKFQEESVIQVLSEQDFNKISKQKGKFTDELFPPNETSLFSGKSGLNKRKPIPKFMLAQMKNTKHLGFGQKHYVWKRLSELYNPNELNIVKEPPTIKEIPDILCSDVVQGEIGDCYFLSVLSSLAENPKRVKNFFPTINMSPNGVFEAKVYVHGEAVRVVVDDYFPCLETEDGGFRIAFTGFNENTKNVWAMIMEKIWAKVNFAYENIIAGVPSDAFEFLCPCPIDDYFHDIHHDEIYHKILEADERNFIITCAITANENPNLKRLSDMGLIPNHAYSILSAYEFTELSGKKIKLLKLRNPWGTNEWKGDWSDESTKWTPEIKELVGWKDSNDGTFFIAYDDFIKFYSTTSVAHYYDNYNFFSGKYSFDASKVFNLVSVKVPNSGKGYFILNQKNRRIYKNIRGNDEFHNKQCSMIVFRRNDNGALVFVNSLTGWDNRMYFETELSAGSYLIAITFPVKQNLESTQNWESFREDYAKNIGDAQLSFRIGLYCDVDKVTMQTVPEKEIGNYTDFLRDLVFAKASHDEIKYSFVEEGEKDAWRNVTYDNNNSALGYIVYNNDSNACINEQITFNTLYGINIIPFIVDGEHHEENDDEIEDAFERQAVQVLKKRPDPSEFKYIKQANPNKQVSTQNPIVAQVKVAPHSRMIIVLEKYDVDSAIDIDSNVVLTYPLHVMLPEKKVLNRKTRIKYNNKFVEIFEIVSEHNSGAIFKYRNKTKDLKINVHIKFRNLNNLTITTRSDEINFEQLSGKEGESNEESKNEVNNVKNAASHDFDIKDRNKEVALSVEPGQTKFFEISSIDLYKPFSYDAEMDYHINLSRGGQ